MNTREYLSQKLGALRMSDVNTDAMRKSIKTHSAAIGVDLNEADNEIGMCMADGACKMCETVLYVVSNRPCPLDTDDTAARRVLMAAYMSGVMSHMVKPTDPATGEKIVNLIDDSGTDDKIHDALMAIGFDLAALFGVKGAQ